MVVSKEQLAAIPELEDVSKLVDENPEHFASGSQVLRDAALAATKYVFDLSIQSENSAASHINELLSSLTPSQAPQTRSQARKRKRSPSPPKALFMPTPLTALFVDNMDEDQIWAQLDLRTKGVCDVLDTTLEETQIDDEEKEGLLDDGDALYKALRELAGDEHLSVEGSWDEDDEDSEEEEDDDDEEDEDDEDEDDEEIEEEGDADESLEGIAKLRDPSDQESDEDDPTMELERRALKESIRRAVSGKPKSGLDDGFFDLRAFNAETEEGAARTISMERLDDEESDDDNISVDLFAPVDDRKDLDEEDSENAPGEAYYKDFFDPPPRTKSRRNHEPKGNVSVRFHDEVRVKKIKAKGKGLPVSAMHLLGDEDEDNEYEDGFHLVDEDDSGLLGEDEGDDLRMDVDEDGDSRNDEDEDDSEDGNEKTTDDHQTIRRLKDDLFADDDDEEQDMTTHERRQASLRDQISALEAENVGVKEWVMTGEANSRSRPQNSLLEEDLEFERVIKAVPVITEEVVKGLEDRIKARILERQFDDVVRIRPFEDKPFLPSRFFELSDNKSKQSLAQIYEDEYIAAQSGNVVGEDRDGKLKQEHDEIDLLWENISHKLDALCNAHFIPKQPKAAISSMQNLPTASLESALPTSKSVTTMLAPEEVFASSASAPRVRSEMTPAEKRSVRTKDRKARKKMRDSLDKGVDKYAKMKSAGSIKKQKQAALESVVKGGKGVTVVGKQRKDILRKKR